MGSTCESPAGFLRISDTPGESEIPGYIVRPDRGCTMIQRMPCIDNTIDRSVFDTDKLKRVFRLSRRFRHDHRDAFADMPHPSDANPGRGAVAIGEPSA